MKKRIISFILIVVMAIGFMPTVTLAANTTEFAGGSGTQSDPYLISTKTHLNNVRNYLDAHFKMTCDIEFTDADFAEGGTFYNNGKGFAPIGNFVYVFTGVFDGSGFAIKNPYINISSSNFVYTGLFVYNKGTIKNLGVVSGAVSSSNYTGGIVGLNEGTIINCYNTGAVSSSNFTGGIAGYNEGTIINCYNTGTISSSDNSGGIAGYNKGTITNSYNTGIVSSYKYTGGIVGFNVTGTILNCYNIGNVLVSPLSSSAVVNAGGIVGCNDEGMIENCYNTGDVSSSDSTGGIAGYNISGTVTNCYNTGTVLASYPYISDSVYAGGIVGGNSGISGIIENCYNTGNVSSSHRSGGIVGCNFEATITNCYNIGTMLSSDYTGGIVAYKHSGTISKSYYLNTISKGVGVSTDGSNDTTTICRAEQMKQQSTFVSFDFESVWTMEGSECYIYPELKNLNVTDHIYDADCDVVCNCGHVRNGAVSHTYQVDYDLNNHFNKCSVCGNVINKKAHEFDNGCDKDCACGYVRTTNHAFGEYVYNNDASEKADGTKTRICSVCGHKETITATGTKWTASFTDIKVKDFYYKPTLWAVANNITTGTSKTAFSPDDPCTRGQVVTFLWRAAGCPEPKSNTMPFTDVGSKAFYRKAVLWAVEQGITSGTSATTFSPNETCTRGQIATFLWRAKSKPAPKSSNMPFVDVAKKDFYYKAVQWAVENKITSGTSKTTFAPTDSCTRGQIVTFLYRAYN